MHVHVFRWFDQQAYFLLGASPTASQKPIVKTRYDPGLSLIEQQGLEGCPMMWRIPKLILQP